ncbi:hypothetical protein V8E54_010923, partial [Elaphomyces granulatus]
METTEHDVDNLTIDECYMLQRFIRLNRLGLFNEAYDYFEEYLSYTCRSWTVLVEVADCLLRDCLFRNREYEGLSVWLEDVKDDWLKVPSSQERQAFALYKGIADIHEEGLLEDSLRQALEVWDSLSISYPDPDFKIDEMEMFLLVLILQIIVTVQLQDSTLLSTMLPESLKDDKIWALFKGVFSYMLDAKQFWEAHRILQLLLEVVPLNVVPLDEAKSLVREYFRKVHQLETQSNAVEVALAATIEDVYRNF